MLRGRWLLYRDDTCAVCGEPLPPDHFYCREHAATVDDRLHEIGVVLGRLTGDLRLAAQLLGEVAPETWDYLAEREDDEPEWPPKTQLAAHAVSDDVDVEVDSEPGRVCVQLGLGLPELLASVAAAVDVADTKRLADACAVAEGANATH